MAVFKVAYSQCTGCGFCRESCGPDALRVTEGYINGKLNTIKAFIKEADCIGCGLCAVICPFGAIYDEDNFPKDEFPTRIPEGYDENFLNIRERFSIAALRDIVDKAGLASGLQSLSHAAITKFIKLTGGVDISPVFEKALKYNVLHKLAFAGTIVNGYEVIVALSDGEITDDDMIDATKFIFLDALTYVPGPIGLLMTGLSVGVTFVTNSK